MSRKQRTSDALPLSHSLRLPEQAIKEFKAAWKKSFNECISDDFAAAEAEKLLYLYSALLRSQSRIEFGSPVTSVNPDI